MDEDRYLRSKLTKGAEFLLIVSMQAWRPFADYGYVRSGHRIVPEDSFDGQRMLTVLHRTVCLWFALC